MNVARDQALIGILAVDDHELVRKGISLLISTESEMQLVAEASTGREAVQEFRKHRPDITLMDLQMPDMCGVEPTRAIRGEFPKARTVVLTTYAGDAQVLRALKAGARGYLLKSEISTETAATIRAVRAGLLIQWLVAGRGTHLLRSYLRDRESDLLGRSGREHRSGNGVLLIAGFWTPLAGSVVAPDGSNRTTNSCPV